MSKKIAFNVRACPIFYNYLCRLQGYNPELQLFSVQLHNYFKNVTKASVLEAWYSIWSSAVEELSAYDFCLQNVYINITEKKLHSLLTPNTKLCVLADDQILQSICNEQQLVLFHLAGCSPTCNHTDQCYHNDGDQK